MSTAGIISMVCILGFYGVCLVGVIWKILHSKSI